MKTHHHPDESTLVSYAAGALPANAALLVSCHLQMCDHCRATIRDAEFIGGTMLEDLPDTPISTAGLASVLRRIEHESEPAPVRVPPQTLSPDELPLPLHDLFGRKYSDIDWSPLVPGVGQVKASTASGTVRMLNIAPGTCLPMHSHRGSEMTLVLRGSYTDEIGRFGVGDVADLDPSVEHQPIVDSKIPCISLVVSDAPLKFRGIVPRMLQPFFGI
ncbi:MAG: ChrR family anti-sigma-E factor [Pseudomonadota bacterium]